MGGDTGKVGVGVEGIWSDFIDYMYGIPKNKEKEHCEVLVNSHCSKNFQDTSYTAADN